MPLGPAAQGLLPFGGLGLHIEPVDRPWHAAMRLARSPVPWRVDQFLEHISRGSIRTHIEVRYRLTAFTVQVQNPSRLCLLRLASDHLCTHPAKARLILLSRLMRHDIVRTETLWHKDLSASFWMSSRLRF